MADHRTAAVVHLGLLARCGLDARMRVPAGLASQAADEALDAVVARLEAVLVDQLLPDRSGVAAALEGSSDQLGEGLARARHRAPGRLGGPLEVGGHLTGRF